MAGKDLFKKKNKNKLITAMHSKYYHKNACFLLPWIWKIVSHFE